jgi:hypothetical protein
MKKTIFAFLLVSILCAVVFMSCSKIREALFPAFEADVDAVSVNIPVTIAGIDWSSTNTVSFNLDSTIKAYTANTFGINGLSSVKIKDVNVFLNNTDALNDISNFDSVRLQLASNVNNTPVEIFNAAIPDNPSTDVNIPAPNCPELKEYLKGNLLTYTVTGRARRTTTKPLDATVSVTVSIK